MTTFKFFLAQHLPLGALRATSLGLLCAIGLWLFAPRKALSQSSVQRDQQAITILTQTIAAGGGSQLLASIQDFTETGTITYNLAEPVTGNVTVKSRGSHQFRVDADLPAGKRTTVVNGEGGSLKEDNGQTRLIYPQSANDLGCFTLPYLPLIAAMQDSTTNIVYEGLVTHNGVSVYDIRFQRTYTKQQDPKGNRGEREARDFYIAPNTYLVSSITDHIHFKAFNDEGAPHEILYTNYQTETGIMAPLTIEEIVHGTPGLTVNLGQVTFNSGLADSEFSW